MKEKRPFYSKIYSQKHLKKITKKIELLGDNTKLNPILFLNLQLFSSIVVFLVVLYLFDWGYLLAPVVTLIYYHLLYYLLIEYNINKRSDKLEIEAMYFFEIMALSLESGNNLKRALEIACDNVDNELSKEFRKTLEEVEYGKSLNEALYAFKKRMPSDAVNNIILNITQANTFGNNVTEDLYRQIDYIRDREIQKTKAHIAKIPLHVSVVSVIFYIPLILLLIISPIIIKFLS